MKEREAREAAAQEAEGKGGKGRGRRPATAAGQEPDSKGQGRRPATAPLVRPGTELPVGENEDITGLDVSRAPLALGAHKRHTARMRSAFGVRPAARPEEPERMCWFLVPTSDRAWAKTLVLGLAAEGARTSIGRGDQVCPVGRCRGFLRESLERFS